MKHDYGLKGKTFGLDDLTGSALQRPEKFKAALAAQTARYEIMVYDWDDLDEDCQPRPYIREELDERTVRRLPDGARQVATMMLRLSPEERRYVLSAFHQGGELKYPWPLKGEKGFKAPK